MSKILAQGMITLTQLYEGVQVILSPTAVLIPCDSEENPKPNAYINASTNVKAFLGTMDITSGITLGELEYSDSTVKASKTGTKVSITTITTRTGYVDIPVSATINGETIDLGKHRFNFVKQIDGQPGIPGDPGFGYTLNIKGGVRGVAYAANGTNPEPKTSSQFSVELLKNGVKVANPASISWTCGGNLSGSSSVATFTPVISSTYNSESSYVKVSIKEFAVSVAVEETIPIVCTKHADGLDWINEWNNQYVQVGTEKIITPKIFAGTKNNANELTGVAIGRDVLGGNANKVIGIVGYKKNTPVFSLDQDANFFVSSSGSAGDVKNGTNNAKGIYFDGNNLYVSGRVRISGGSTIGENNTSVEDVINNSNLGVQANNKLNNLSIGGRNLIRKADLGQNNSTATYDGATNTWTVNATAGGGGTWGCGLVVKNKNALVPYGKAYVLSFEIKVPRACSWNCDVNSFPLTGSNWAGNDNDNGSKRTMSSRNLVANQWIKCWIKWENTHPNNTNKVDIYDNSHFGVVMKDETSNMTYQIRNVKGELGNVPTEWTPAPEDVQADIDKKANNSEVYKKTETYSKTQTDSAIEVAKNEINLGISSTYETKTNVESKISTANTTTLNSAKSYADTKKSEAITQAGKDADSKVNSAKNELNTAINKKANSSDVYTKSQVYTKEEANSQIKVVKDEINLGVSNTYETKANVETKVNNAVNNIQVGGRNLLTGTKDFSVGKGTGTVHSEKYNGFTVLYNDFSTATSGFSDVCAWYSAINVKQNTEYTLSFYAKGSGDITSYFYPSNVASGYSSEGKKTNAADGGITHTLTNNWKRYWIVWKTLPNTTGLKNVLPMRLFPGATGYICGVKFEEGNKATDWSPAPEDVQADINSKVDNIQIGGRNLLVGTATPKSGNFNCPTGFSTFDPYTTSGKKTLADLGFKAGDEVTISFDWKISKNGSLAEVYGHFKLEWKGIKSDGTDNMYVGAISNLVDTFSASNKSGHVVIVTKLDSNTVKAHTLRFRIDNSVLTFTASNVMVEKGNKASSWTPAPEDIQADLNAKASKTDVYTKTETYTKAETDSAIKVAKDNITLSVSNTYETKTNVETKVNNAVTGLKVGGNNLLRNGNFAYAMTNWLVHDMNSGGTAKSVAVENGGGDWKPANKKVLVIKGTNTTDRYGVISSTMKLIPKTKYTISGYCAGHRVNKIQVNVRDKQASDANIHTININPVAGGSTLDQWYRFETTFTTTSNTDFALNLYSVNFADNGYVWFCDIQIQQGTKATAWTPCLEDIDSAIGTKANSTDVYKKTEVYTKNETNSQINAKANEITSSVSSTYETKTNVDTKIKNSYNNRIIYARGTGNEHSQSKIIKVGNSTILNAGTRGLTVVALNPTTLAKVSENSYDTHLSGDHWTNCANKINELNNGNYIIVVVSYDNSNVHNASITTALRKIGGTAFVPNGVSPYREAYALIGKSKLGEGNGVEMYIPRTADDKRFAEISVKISDEGALMGVNSDGSRSLLTNHETRLKSAESKITNDAIVNTVTSSTAWKQTSNVVNQMTQGTRCHKLGAKINYSEFGVQNSGEMYLHGYNSNNEPADVNGSIVFSGVTHTLAKGMVNPNADFGLGVDVYLFKNPNTSHNATYGAYYDTSSNTWKWRALVGATGSGNISMNEGYIAFGQFNMKDAETFNYATLYNEPVLLKNCVSYKEEVSGQYATKSSLTQTTNSIIAKFEASGGYNLLKNSGFLTGDWSYWSLVTYNNPTNGERSFLSSTATWGFPDSSIKTCQLQLSNQSSKEFGISQKVTTTIGKKYTISFYTAAHRLNAANVIVRRADGTWLSNKYFNPQDSTKNGGNTSVDKWLYITHTFTATQNEHAVQIVINAAQENGYMWIAKPQVVEGEAPLSYSPNPSEIYAGITTIDKDGITVTASNVKSKTSMSANGFKITKTDNNEDVFKVNSDGTLTLKGNMTITGGSVSDNALSSTIRNGASAGSSAKSTLDSNSSNWGNAYNRVKEWASGAVTGSTNINGGMIATDTITAKQMAIGDFNNYSQLAKGKNLSNRYGTAEWVEGTGNHSFWKTTNAYFPFTVNETLNPFKAGDKIQIKFDAYTPSTRNVSVGVWFYSDTAASTHIGNVTANVSCSNSWGTKTVNLTLPTGNTYVQNAKSIAILINNGSSGERIEVRNATVNRLVAGDLIVNGTITTDHIHTNGLNASVIKAGTISADRLDANTIVSKVNGGTTTISGNKITTGTISADKLKIQSRDSFSVNPNFANWTSTYPYGTQSWVDGGISKVTVDNRSVAQFNVSNASSQQGMHLNSSFFNTGLNLDGMQYIGLEVKYRLTSGTNPAGACMLLDIFYTDGSYDRLNLSLKSINPTVTTNTWYTAKRVFKVSNIQKTFKSVSGYLLANWSSETLTAKTIQFASANAYACTEQDYLTQTWTSGTEINGASIKTGTLSASKITTGTLDASKISVTNLNASNITSGTLKGRTIEGGTIRNGSTVIDSNGITVNNGAIKVKNKSNKDVLWVDSNGQATVDNLQVYGNGTSTINVYGNGHKHLRFESWTSHGAEISFNQLVGQGTIAAGRIITYPEADQAANLYIEAYDNIIVRSTRSSVSSNVACPLKVVGDVYGTAFRHWGDRFDIYHDGSDLRLRNKNTGKSLHLSNNGIAYYNNERLILSHNGGNVSHICRKNGYLEILTTDDGAKGIDYWNSDLKFKKNVQSIKSLKIKEDVPVTGLNLVNSIEHYTFDYKDGKHINVGYVSQQLETIDETLINKIEQPKDSPYWSEEDPYTRQPNVSTILPNVTLAIQEQQQIINAQSIEIEELKQKNEELEKRLKLIEEKLGL